MHSLWSAVHGEFLLTPLLPLEAPDDGGAVLGAGDEAAAGVAPLEAVDAVRVGLLLQNPLRTVLQVRTVHSGWREAGRWTSQFIIYFLSRAAHAGREANQHREHSHKHIVGKETRRHTKHIT